MSQPKRPTPREVLAAQREVLAAQIEQRRRELSARLDNSPRLRQFSSSTLPQGMLPERLRRSPVFAGVVVAAVAALMVTCLLGGAGVVAGGFSLQGQLGGPSTTAQDFYAALHQQEYSRAYAQLSSAAQQRISRNDFTVEYSDLDAVAGVVESYTIGSATMDGASATVVAEVVRREDPTRGQWQTIALVRDNGAWQVDRIAVGDSGPAPNQ